MFVFVYCGKFFFLVMCVKKYIGVYLFSLEVVVMVVGFLDGYEGVSVDKGIIWF